MHVVLVIGACDFSSIFFFPHTSASNGHRSVLSKGLGIQ